MSRDRAAYMRAYRAKRRMRDQVLGVFGVTDAEITGLGSDGYDAARRQAEAERAAYVKHLEAEVARLERELTAKLIAPAFNSRPFTPVPKK